MPMEFARKVRPFSAVKKYKMRESRNAVAYVLQAVLAIPRLAKAMEESQVSTFQSLILGIHILGGYTHMSPTEVHN